MTIDIDTIVKMLCGNGQQARAGQDQQDLTDQVDTAETAVYLDKFGANRADLIAKFAGRLSHRWRPRQVAVNQRR